MPRTRIPSPGAGRSRTDAALPDGRVPRWWRSAGLSPGGSKLDRCVRTITSPVIPGRPAARPGSARCPGPTRTRRCASSPVSCPISRTCPSCPDRGPGADMVGRTAGLLIDIPVEVTPRGWRLAERPGRDMARARSMLSTDLDVMEEVLEGYRGSLKIQLCGPWTLAAALEAAAHAERGHRRSGRRGRSDRLAGRRRRRVRRRRHQARPGRPACRAVRRALAVRAWPRARCRPRAGCPGWPRPRRTCCATGWLRSSPASAKLHDRPLLRFKPSRSACSERPGRQCPVLRPQPATARGRGRRGRGGRGRAGPADRRGRDRASARAGPAPGLDRGRLSPGTVARGVLNPRRPAGARDTANRVIRLYQRLGLPLDTLAAAGRDHARLRAGWRFPRSGARRVDALPRGGEHAG